MTNGKSHHIPPDHFPVYFYMMAIIIYFGGNAIAARIITWMIFVIGFFFMINTLGKLSSKEFLFLEFLYLADPLMFVTNYYGKFDQIAITFMFWGIYHYSKNQKAMSGLVLGLGVMTKFFPVFLGIAIGLHLLAIRDYKGLTNFSISSVLSSGSIFLYHYLRWGNRFLNVITFQLTRENPSLSWWYYSNLLNLLQFIELFIFLLVVVILLYIVKNREFANNEMLYPFTISSILLSVYLSFTRQYYSTYFDFLYVMLIPLLLYSLKLKRYQTFSFMVFFVLIFYLGNILCWNSCYPQFHPFTIISYIGVTFVFLSSLAFILITFYELLKLTIKRE